MRCVCVEVCVKTFSRVSSSLNLDLFLNLNRSRGIAVPEVGPSKIKKD